MELNVISLMVAVLALLISLAVFYAGTKERKTKTPPADLSTIRPLQLQAYERLVMLADRIALPNLVSRANQSGVTQREMQLLLVGIIKQEFEYNTTQQIYVSPVAWEAVTNLKEQNIMIINQVAGSMPLEATGVELNRMLLEFVMTQKKGALHTIVLEALNYEARKIMK